MPFDNGLCGTWEAVREYWETRVWRGKLARQQSRVLIAFLGVILFLLLHIGANAQSGCPIDAVCITREAALKALADADRVKALEAEIKVKDEAYDAQKDLLNQMRIEFAEKSGENTALKQNAVQDRAIIAELLKNTKKKCLPFSVCVF